MEGLNKPVYADHERICRVWDKEEIKDLMGRRAYYASNDMRREELDDLWVRKPENRKTASFGRNWGYYVGMDSISNYYVVEYEKRRQARFDAYCAVRPELENIPANLGFGSMSMYTITTPVIVVAGDGKTARGLWYAVGQETAGNADGTADAMWVCEKQAADFILEDGQWKIWHLILSNDFTSEPSHDFADDPVYYDEGEDILRNEFGHCDIPLLVHDPIFNWCDNYPPMPEPYQSFDSRDSYGPEGHPGLGRQNVERDYEKYLEKARREKNERKA